MTRVLGVDGARGGWVAASVEVDGTSGRVASVSFLPVPDMAAALASDAAAVGVDMPIVQSVDRLLGGASVDSVLEELLSRPPRAEGT